MTLDEAIKHCEEVAADLESETDEVTELYDDCECREEHLQLAEWLTELKERRNGGWISCKDRMPEVNEPVLFIFNTEGGFKAVMYGWHETIKGLGSGWHQAGVGGARADEEVTYWQPLPEPPEIGGADDENS